MSVNGVNGNGTAIANGDGPAATADDGLRVTIVGAGIGGLATALFLRQQGHRVTLLEQSRFASEVGAALHLAPNCNGLLRRCLGLHAETIGGTVMRRQVEYDVANNLQRAIPLEASNQQWQHPWHLVHRVSLHEELKRRATAPAPAKVDDGQGPPAKLLTSSRVVAVDAEAATVTLEDGTVVEGDVVLGADGVHSVTRRSVPGGGDVAPRPSGKCAFRFLVPRQALLDNPQTARFVQEDGQLTIWYGTGRRIVMYPCNNDTVLNFVCMIPRDEAADLHVDQATWSTAVSLDAMVERFAEFHEDTRAVLRLADPASLKLWELLDMDVLPTWAHGRLALLGDAAHPFLPHQGQGAGQALEDAAALGAVLQRGTPVAEIPERLRLYVDIRQERANRIQEYSRLAGSETPGKNPDMLEYANYNFGHDEWDYAVQRVRKWDWARKPRLYWRMPVSFGPFPGPRQTFEGLPRSGADSTFVTASIKFKTSRTLLQNLFPSAAFRFAHPGTVAYASFSQTTLDRMQWLGGSGYHHLGLYLHGVELTAKDGTVYSGTYMPLLFESLTDPIVSGREELGMPKLYCALDIAQRATSYRIQASWQGAHFGSLALEGLVDADPSISKGTIGGEDDEGIFAYKYMPKVGDRGQADCEHPTFVPHAEEAKVVNTVVKRVRVGSKASIKFDGLDWEALPTLHHVVARLAEIPIYDIVSVKVVEGVGVPDVSSARRVD